MLKSFWYTPPSGCGATELKASDPRTPETDLSGITKKNTVRSHTASQYSIRRNSVPNVGAVCPRTIETAGSSRKSAKKLITGMNYEFRMLFPIFRLKQSGYRPVFESGFLKEVPNGTRSMGLHYSRLSFQSPAHCRGIPEATAPGCD